MWPNVSLEATGDAARFADKVVPGSGLHSWCFAVTTPEATDTCRASDHAFAGTDLVPCCKKQGLTVVASAHRA